MRRLAPILRDLLAADEAVAVVTVAEARGSTPRGTGTRMLVTAGRFFASIGGGRLEYDAIGEARCLLAGDERHLLREVPLGPALGQCCGGHATVLIERADEADLGPLEALDAGAAGALLTRLDRPAPKLLVTGADEAPDGLDVVVARVVGTGIAERVALAGATWLVEPTADDLAPVHLFGAGHVGRALAVALSPLPCRVRWIDHRPELFREPAPPGVEVVMTEHPIDRVAEAAAGAFFLVMTPSHDLDREICEAVLRRGDFAFLGLIGSLTKRARFEKRWRAKGIPDRTIRRLVCPIGLPGIGGKEPAVIAASTAAQLLQAFEMRPQPARLLEPVA